MLGFCKIRIKVCQKVTLQKRATKRSSFFVKKSPFIFQEFKTFFVTLSDSKVLMIYEIPEDTQPRFRNNVKALLENYKMNKTILVFTHSDVYDDVADMKYNISRGKITGVSVKGETKRPAKKQTKRSKASPKKKTN